MAFTVFCKEYEIGVWPECPYPSLPVVTHEAQTQLLPATPWGHLCSDLSCFPYARILPSEYIQKQPPLYLGVLDSVPCQFAFIELSLDGVSSANIRDARQMVLQKTLLPVFLGWWVWWCGPWSEDPRTSQQNLRETFVPGVCASPWHLVNDCPHGVP